jgi:hypothetical protein
MTEQTTPTAPAPQKKKYRYFVTGLILNGSHIGYRTKVVSKASPIRDEIDVANLRDLMRKELGSPTLEIMAFNPLAG